ncbi:hypothetical protein GCM10027297_32900 [Parahaliea aestuarii]
MLAQQLEVSQLVGPLDLLEQAGHFPLIAGAIPILRNIKPGERPALGERPDPDRQNLATVPQHLGNVHLINLNEASHT